MVNQGCMSLPTYYLEHGHHVPRLHLHCCHAHPQAIPLAMITIRKSIHGFPSLSMGMGLHLAAFSHCSSTKMSRKDADELFSIQQKHIDSLIYNIDKCFESFEINGVLLAFGIFDPALMPGTEMLVSKHIDRKSR